MYQDLKKIYWWKRMKVDIAKHVASFGVCQRVKVELNPHWEIAVFRGSFMALG
jgi:hypothetical protein